MSAKTIKITVESFVSIEDLWDLLESPLKAGVCNFYVSEYHGDREAFSVTAIDPQDPDGETLKTYTIDATQLALGAERMATLCPRAMRQFLSNRWDAYTGDVFLQCTIFGDAVYG